MTFEEMIPQVPSDGWWVPVLIWCPLLLLVGLLPLLFHKRGEL